MSKIAVMGSGSWGTALSVLLHNNGHQVTLWSFSQRECDEIKANRENKEFLPGIEIPLNLEITTSIEEAINGKEIIVVAIPSKFIRANIKNFSQYINKEQIIVNVSKGLEKETLLTLSQVINEILPDNNIAVLSGPSHAEEVSKKVPTTCVVSSLSKKVAEKVQDVFMNNYFRVYTNADILGVELGGALKNVIALATGIAVGLGYGDNTKAALMTRGNTEILRLGVAMGADFQTFNGLSGIGDLIVTCTSKHSRNRRAGILLGKGNTLDETLKEVHMVVEGVHTAKAALEFAKKYNVEMPITEVINKVLFENLDTKVAVQLLMDRDRRSEYLSSDLISDKEINWKYE